MAGILTSVSFAASAQWVSQVEDDVFSNAKKASMYATFDYTMNQAIAFDCTNDALTMAYIEKTKESSNGGLPVELLIKIDSGSVVKLQATSGIRNADYFQIASDDKDEIIEVLKQASKAKSKMLIGLSVPSTNYKQSFTVGVGGSTAAVKKFTEACGIDVK